MCELLGISISPAAKMGVYFKAFRPRAEENQSGWGVGWYEQGRARVIKEASRADESAKALALVDEHPTSDVFVVHVRKATVGDVSLENTHPFTRRVKRRDWLFAHNGTIDGLERLDVNGFVSRGDTDSEVAFHFLLTRLLRASEAGSSGGNGRAPDEASEILKAAKTLSEDGKVNFLLTDGKTLYAYHDGHKSLHFLERSPAQPSQVRLADDTDYVVDLAETGIPGEHAVIVATVPLNEERWTRFEPGQFLTCRAGKVVNLLGPELGLPEHDRR